MGTRRQISQTRSARRWLRWRRHAFALSLAVCLVTVSECRAKKTAHAEEVWVSDSVQTSHEAAPDDSPLWRFDSLTDPVLFQQPLTPRIEAQAAPPLTTTARTATQQFWTSFGTSPPSFATTRAAPAGAAVVSGQEAAIRLTTDAGDLLGGSAAVLDLGLQRRNPVVNDPRVRGSQVGSLAASGSYWVPARIDLDTMASKIDSRLIEDILVFPGPYSALYGPGKQFIDFEMKRTPRYTQGGLQINGSTSVDYHTNGQPWYGRQSIWGGDDVWGFRAGYGHRTGNDYASGDGTLIPASFKSRDIDVALGAQLTDDASIEGQALRLDQTDVELAGQAFDLDWLKTDAYEAEYAVTNAQWADRVVLEAWYNRTQFDGSAQRPSKRKQFPFYDTINFVGFTNVDSISTGYRLVSRWEDADGSHLDAGPDLRYVEQQLNEFSSGRVGFAAWDDANSPIPESNWVNPGLFIEASSPADDPMAVAVGARIDYVGTNVLASDAQLQALGVQSKLPGNPPLSAFDYWGTNTDQTNDLVGLGYITIDARRDDGWGAGFKVGYSERAPNLTEHYAVQPFMDLIQNGLNTVTGDPDLDKERLLQTDVRISHTSESFHGEVGAYYSWVHDFVTYEALSAVPGPPNAQIEQLNLKYVNTELATLWGASARAEYQWNELLTPFATVSYIQGTDRTRNGAFATQEAKAGNPSVQVAGLPRGFYSGVAGGATEPLPSIVPLVSRLGLRWEDKQASTRWGVEVAARVVAAQNRVATSLLETPTAGFTVWDIQTFIRPTDNWQLVGGVENFTDKQYREHLDYRSRNPNALSTFRAGISFYAGSELKY